MASQRDGGIVRIPSIGGQPEAGIFFVTCPRNLVGPGLFMSKSVAEVKLKAYEPSTKARNNVKYSTRNVYFPLVTANA